MARVIIYFFLFVYNLQGAAECDEKAFYIFNITKSSSLYIRLREEKAPHVVLKPSGARMAALTEEIFKLPANACIKILYEIKTDNRLRLRIWPDSAEPHIFNTTYEEYSFCGKLIPPGGNIFMLGYPSEWKRSATVKLRAKGYEVKRNKIVRQKDTPHTEDLCIARTHSLDLGRFKTDLSEIIKNLYPTSTAHQPPYFETIAELTKPLTTDEVMSAVFDIPV